MVKFKTIRQAQLKQAVQTVKEAIKNFSEESKNQVNLSAESSHHELSHCIVMDLIERGLIVTSRREITVFHEAKRFTEKDAQKVALVDIDETICFYADKRRYDLSKPNYENIAKINSLYEKGWKIVYWTARGSSSGNDYTEHTQKQLEKWGCKYHDLVTGTGLNPKPHFDLLIDDKAKRIEEL